MENSNRFYHETIIPNDKIPVKIFSFSAKDTNRVIPMHWHRSAELLFVVEGKLIVWEKNKKYELQPGDFIYINSNEIHSTQSPIKNTVIVLQIAPSFLKKFDEEEGFYINCNTLYQTEDKLPQYETIKGLLYQIYAHHRIKESYFHLKIYSLLFELAYILMHFFLDDAKMVHIQSQKYMDRLLLICDYIKEHHAEELKLGDVADHFHYSPQYLARLFKNYVGISFLGYLNQIRLDQAYKRILESDMSILEISETCGFPSTKALNKVFKETYHTTPKQFRNQYQIK